MEKVIIKLKAVASILIHMSYAKDNIKDSEHIFGLLSEELYDCIYQLSKNMENTDDEFK